MNIIVIPRLNNRRICGGKHLWCPFEVSTEETAYGVAKLTPYSDEDVFDEHYVRTELLMKYPDVYIPFGDKDEAKRSAYERNEHDRNICASRRPAWPVEQDFLKFANEHKLKEVPSSEVLDAFNDYLLDILPCSETPYPVTVAVARRKDETSPFETGEIFLTTSRKRVFMEPVLHDSPELLTMRFSFFPDDITGRYNAFVHAFATAVVNFIKRNGGDYQDIIDAVGRKCILSRAEENSFLITKL